MKRHIWEQHVIRRITAVLEGFREKKAQWVAAGADAAQVDAAIVAFKSLKQRRMLSPEEADIDRFDTFEQLQQLVAQAASRKRSPTAKTRKITRVEGADILHDDEQWTIVVPHTKAASQLYGKGTKWCTSATGDCRFNQGTYKGIKHHIFISKTKSSADPHYKLNLCVYPDGRMQLYDAPDQQIGAESLKEITGFDAKEFSPWKWNEAPALQQWALARAQGMPFAKFVGQVDDAVWEELGNHVAGLKTQWMQSEDEKEPKTPRTEEGWKQFWQQCRAEATEPAKPSDEQLATLSPEQAQRTAEEEHKEFLGTLAYYMELNESRIESRAHRLVKALLEG